MNNLPVYDELDQAIDQMLATPANASTVRGSLDRETNVDELLELASDLRHLPRNNFKMRLKLELEWEAAGRTVSTADADAQMQFGHATKPAAGGQILTSLFGKNWSGYPVRRVNFVASVAMHALMLCLLGAGLVMVKSIVPRVEPQMGVSVRLEPITAPIGTQESLGGGSGGTMDKRKATVGMAPRAAHEQLTTPVVLQNNQHPRLEAEATVIAPPDLNIARARQIGDPLSDIAAPSNGPGVNGGIGGNAGGGVGVGEGPGRGNRYGTGCCDGIYPFGNGVSMPRAIYSPEPEFSEEARKSKYQGEVTLLATIGADGRTRNLVVVRSLGMGLDEKALETVRTWRFDPAKKDGHPVAVQMNIIVNFHLF